MYIDSMLSQILIALLPLMVNRSRVLQPFVHALRMTCKRPISCMAVLMLFVATASANATPKPSAAELAAITARGRMLAAYDAAAWQATDAVMATHPKAEPSGRYIARLTEAGWVVDFGHLNAAGDKFLVNHEAMQVDNTARFDVKNFDPAREEGGWDLSAARGIETASKNFGQADRPYNIAVLPRSSGGLYVYLYPAQVKAGVYPLGADVRYLLSPDGTKIVEKRQMHKTILEYAPPTDPSESIAGGYHTHVLSDLPEDTDVMLVLTRQPRVQETVGAGGYIFTIATDGTITVADRPVPHPSRLHAKGGKQFVPTGGQLHLR